MCPNDKSYGCFAQGGIVIRNTLERLVGLLTALNKTPDTPLTKFDPRTEIVPRVYVDANWGLKVMQRNEHDKVLCEHGADDGDKVERTTSYHVDGSQALQETIVTSKLFGNRQLFNQKETWDKLGKLEFSFCETNLFDGTGNQEMGNRKTQHFEFGRLHSEIDEQWSPETKLWLENSQRMFAYYQDGDIKECLTVNPVNKEKKIENWGSKGRNGRDKATCTWNADTCSWTEAS
jgi:hypothetical protein